jgi:DNA/RNA endonuclease YhcR with UshA esterase domain
MRRLSKVQLLLVAMATVAVTFASQNPQQGSTSIPNYDSATEVRLQGVVLDANDHLCPISGGMGSHLILKIQNGTIEVHMGAAKFVKEYQLILAKGDNVEVLGSRVIFEGRDAILAREITRGQETFVFRDANGKPVW